MKEDISLYLFPSYSFSKLEENNLGALSEKKGLSFFRLAAFTKLILKTKQGQSH